MVPDSNKPDVDPNDPAKSEDWLLLDLSVTFPIASKALKTNLPIVSLTFPGVSYIANRKVQWLYRDVKDNDDERMAA